MTFVGESVALDWANPISGAPFGDYGDAIRYREGSSTVTGGDSFIAGFFDSATLASGDAVVAQFVVVCGVGSAGSLRISGGTDPDWSLDDPGDASQSLGTFTVSGAEDVLSGPLTFDVDAYLAQTVETVAFIECLSGSVVIEQVKLRLWPPGGAVGGWSSPYPGFTTTYELPSITGGDKTSDLVESASGDPETMWNATMGALPGSAGVVGPLGLGGPGYGLQSAGGNAWAYAAPLNEGIIDIVYSISGVNAVVKAMSSGGVAILYGPPPVFTYPGPGLTEGVDFVYPPDEVPDDPDASWVLPLGSVGYVWENTTATVETGPDASDPLPVFGMTVTSETTSVDPLLPGPYLDRDLSAGGTIVNMTNALTYSPVALTASDRWVIVYIWSSLAVIPPPWPEVAPLAGGNRSWVADGVLHFGQGLPGETFAPMRVARVMPSYRVWSPTATVVVPPLRQRNRGRVRSRLRADRQRSIRSRGFL